VVRTQESSAGGEHGLALSVSIVTGGQTGVDRAAMDIALSLGLRLKGWCPLGRWAEDGPVPEVYPLRETPGVDPGQRTSWNVRDADATLVLIMGTVSGGTALTVEEARQAGKPCLQVAFAESPDLDRIRDWMSRNHVHSLNIAGPRESEEPGIYRKARQFLAALFGTSPEQRDCAT
jgi:hypothetical protein